MVKRTWYRLEYKGNGSCAGTSSVHYFYGTMSEMPRYSHTGLGLETVIEVTDPLKIAFLEDDTKKVDELLNKRITATE